MRRGFALPAALAAVFLMALPMVARAEDDAASSTDKSPAKTAEKPKLDAVTTEGTVTVGGVKIAYDAIAGTLPVGATDAQDAQLGLDGQPLPGSQLALEMPKDDKGDKDEKNAEPVARMFYVAYFKKDAKADERPITFFYNGGPGSSTVWLHMGSMGPRNVETDGDEHLPAAPYKLDDNANSLLDTSDLVFIDMPGTGFGRLTGKDAEKAFWGIDEDANAFARFITRFLSVYGRWNSPKYLFGESYGTTRSAVLADVLENDHDVDLNGVILLSQIFNFTTDIDQPSGNPGVDLPYVLALPTYAATAWYHKKLPQPPAELEPLLQEVEAFTMGPYAHALAQGTDIDAEEKQSVAEKLHAYTGLPVDYLLKANLRVSGGEFEKTLQDNADLTTGRLDTRFSGPTLDALSEDAGYDPQSAAISSAYVSLFNDYVRHTLKYGDGLTYLPEAQIDDSQWDMVHKGNHESVNVAPDLADAMKMDPRLKVMVNGGYYDLATPFFAAQYEDKHLPIPQSLAKNIQFDWYESGHMVYVRDESRKQLHDRVAAFIRSTETAGK